MNQEDSDSDDIGDACDGEDYSFKPKTDPNKPPPDDDKDGIADDSDNCPNDANADQKDTDKDGQGDACDLDDDGDGINDIDDNCPKNANPTSTWIDKNGVEHADEQPDYGLDGLGNACDLDDDNDNILDTCNADNNPAYSDADGDNVIDNCDNCKNDPNPDQLDSDKNGIGDVCEPDFIIKFTLSDPLNPGQNIYDTWLPKDGRQAQITAKLVDKSGNPLSAAIALTFVDSLTSHLPGKYTNDPSIDTSYDYSVTSGDGTSVITIKSHDYGGKTVIKAETIYNGKPIFGELRVPKDSDDDGLSDAFELDTNLNPSGKLDPFKQDSDSDNTWDALEDQEGAANQDPGDDLIAGEEYRGVMWNGEHHRLSTERKNLFVVGVDFADQGFPFAIGDAFKNADVDVLSIETISFGQQWDQISTNNFEDENIDVLIVRSYASGWSGGDYNTGHIRRIGVRKWDIPVLGESYIGNDNLYGEPTKVYGRSVKNYFNDRPYWDGGAYIDTNGDGQPDTYVVPPDGHLNPRSDPTVEDQDDNSVLLGKKEDTYITNGRLDGDRIDTDMSTWANQGKLNPFNIDNDAYVELPQNKGDPYTVPPGDEYDMAKVFRHVITHELGHAVGMGKGDPDMLDAYYHCFDSNCVMYKSSINWKRDGYFCPYHQELIRIHNN